MQKNLSEKRKDRDRYDEKFKEAKAKYERAKYNRAYSFAEKKERERNQNKYLDLFVKKDQEVKTISDQLYGISRCKYDLFQGKGFAGSASLSMYSLYSIGHEAPSRLCIALSYYES